MQQVGVVAQGKPDEHRFTYYLVFRRETLKTRILEIVTVAVHHEVVILPDGVVSQRLPFC